MKYPSMLAQMKAGKMAEGSKKETKTDKGLKESGKKDSAKDSKMMMKKC